MFKITTTLNKLVQALEENYPISGLKGGYWHLDGMFKRMLSPSDDQWASLAEAFCFALDEIESIPIQFADEEVPQTIPFKSYLKVANLILEHLKTCTSHEALKQLKILKRRYTALLYRLESINGGLDSACPSEEVIQKLFDLATDWKHNHVIIIEKMITEKDRHKLIDAAQYPEFVALLFEDQELKNAFMLWSLQDKNAVAPFIQFPGIQEKLVDCALSGRIGRQGGNTLRIKKEYNEEGSVRLKLLTLPIEGQDINILDGNHLYTFRGNYTLTINEMFEVFRNKKTYIGNLEFFAEGITNWNNHRLGWWDADKQVYQTIDVDKPEWWNQLPIFEVLSKKEAQQKYGWHLDGSHWNAAATASRGSASLDFERTHAYLEMAIPLPEGKRYAVYDFGKFADQFPANHFETLSMFCRNVHAVVAYPDENVFYSHRQHAYHSFCLTSEEGKKLMNLIKRDILHSREKNFVYQIESENCAKWTHELLEKILGEEFVPNLFKMSLLHTEPVGPVAKLFELIKKLPQKFQTKVLTTLHLPLGAFKGTWIVENGKKVKKSLTNHPFWETAEVYLPAFLHKQKETGSLAFVVEPATVARFAIRNRSNTRQSPELNHSFPRRFIHHFRSIFSTEAASMK